MVQDTNCEVCTHGSQVQGPGPLRSWRVSLASFWMVPPLAHLFHKQLSVGVKEEKIWITHNYSTCFSLFLSHLALVLAWEDTVVFHAFLPSTYVDPLILYFSNYQSQLSFNGIYCEVILWNSSLPIGMCWGVGNTRKFPGRLTSMFH